MINLIIDNFFLFFGNNHVVKDIVNDMIFITEVAYGSSME